MNKLSQKDKAHNRTVIAGVDVLTAWQDRQVLKRERLEQAIEVYSKGNSEVCTARVIAAKEDIRLSLLFDQQISNCKDLMDTLTK